MNGFIDLGSEFLVDSSTIADPYLRLFAIAVGQKMVPGSPWMAIKKSVAEACNLRGNPFEDATSVKENGPCEVDEAFCFARLANRRLLSNPAPRSSAPFPIVRRGGRGMG